MVERDHVTTPDPPDIVGQGGSASLCGEMTANGGKQCSVTSIRYSMLAMLRAVSSGSWTNDSARRLAASPRAGGAAASFSRIVSAMSATAWKAFILAVNLATGSSS